jgi:hypothetical protein
MSGLELVGLGRSEPPQITYVVSSEEYYAIILVELILINDEKYCKKYTSIIIDKV